jgi:hypothetical protein
MKAWVWYCVVIQSIDTGAGSRLSVLRYVPLNNSPNPSFHWSGVAHTIDVDSHLADDYKEEKWREVSARFTRTAGISARGILSAILRGNPFSGSRGVIRALYSMLISGLRLKADPMIGYERSPALPYDAQGAATDPSWTDVEAGTWAQTADEELQVVDMDLSDDTRLSRNVSMASTLSMLTYFDLHRISRRDSFLALLPHQAPGFPVFVEGDSRRDQQVFIYLFASTRTVWLVFRGTQSLTDVLHDLDFRLIGVDNLHSPRIRAHAGFVTKWNSVRDGVFGVLDSHKDQFDYMITTGHSLGGALATLAAPFLVEHFPEKLVECISFGSPRVGNDNFVAWYSHLVDISTRIVNQKDPFVQMPIEPEFHHVHDAYTIASNGNRWRLADSPAAHRFIDALADLDWNGMLGSHHQNEYVDRIKREKSLRGPVV